MAQVLANQGLPRWLLLQAGAILASDHFAHSIMLVATVPAFHGTSRLSQAVASSASPLLLNLYAMPFLAQGDRCSMQAPCWRLSVAAAA
jgi:hypothetical protein